MEMTRLAMSARIDLAAPETLLAKIHHAAEMEAMTSAEFMRNAIRRLVKQVEQRQRPVLPLGGCSKPKS